MLLGTEVVVVDELLPVVDAGVIVSAEAPRTIRAQKPSVATVHRSPAHPRDLNIDHPPESRVSLSGDGSLTRLRVSHPDAGCSDRVRSARLSVQTTWTADLAACASRKHH
jgi:hypothetical protein